MIFEYCSKGSLSDMITLRTNLFRSESVVAHILTEIASGLNYLHNFTTADGVVGIIHRYRVEHERHLRM